MPLGRPAPVSRLERALLRRAVSPVAGQLGYSSGAAFRRAIKATVGGRPTPLRNRAAFDSALETFASECPGDPGIRRALER